MGARATRSRTVKGTYDSALEESMSLARYTPETQSARVTIRALARQEHSTVKRGPTVGHADWGSPRTGPIMETRRPPAPWYQPSRKTSARNEAAVVRTNSSIGSPALTLVAEANPS